MGQIDQSTFDSQMAGIIPAANSADASASELTGRVSGTAAISEIQTATAAAKDLAAKVRFMYQYMTTPPEGAGDPQRASKQKGHKGFDKDFDPEEAASAKAGHDVRHGWKGFGKK